MASEVASDWQVLVPRWKTTVPCTLTHTSGAATAVEPVSSVNDTASRAPRTALRPLAGVEDARSCRRARVGSSSCSGVTIRSFALRGVYAGMSGRSSSAATRRVGWKSFGPSTATGRRPGSRTRRARALTGCIRGGTDPTIDRRYPTRQPNWENVTARSGDQALRANPAASGRGGRWRRRRRLSAPLSRPATASIGVSGKQTSSLDPSKLVPSLVKTSTSTVPSVRKSSSHRSPARR